MKRLRPWKRQAAPASCFWPPIALVDLPDDLPDDVRELARLAAVDGPELLAGIPTTEAGLLVMHPRSPVCPDDFAQAGRVLVLVQPLSWLQVLATGLHLLAPLRPQPGCHVALIVGATRAAHLALASVAVGAREAS